MTDGIAEPEVEQDDTNVRKHGWKRLSITPSLPEVNRSIHVPSRQFMWRRALAFAGPGYLIAVGYMDPGNWATDIAAGSVYNYSLLSVVLIANFIAIFLQALSAKLGIVSERDLAQACRDAYSRPVSIGLWLSAEIGIIACDVAEVLGAAIALNLLFHIPLVWGVALTALDVLIVLALQHKGFRLVEAFVITLIGTMMVIFGLEIAYSRPDWTATMRGFIPTSQIVTDPKMLYIALGILGATVMPHNLYLHSSIVQTRRHGRSAADVRDALRYSYTDSTVALMLALFVNAAILIVSAATFYRTGHHEVGEIQDAYKLLSPLLGVAVATPLFAVALLASGQNSTLTGTLAGQIVLEGFTRVPDPAVASAHDLTHARDRAVHIRGCMVWRQGNRRTAPVQPGDSFGAARICGDSARSVHERPNQDGRVRERDGYSMHGLGTGRDHRGPERISDRDSAPLSSGDDYQPSRSVWNPILFFETSAGGSISCRIASNTIRTVTAATVAELDIANCDIKFVTSAAVISNMKSSGIAPPYAEC